MLGRPPGESFSASHLCFRMISRGLTVDLVPRFVCARIRSAPIASFHRLARVSRGESIILPHRIQLSFEDSAISLFDNLLRAPMDLQLSSPRRATCWAARWGSPFRPRICASG